LLIIDIASANWVKSIQLTLKTLLGVSRYTLLLWFVLWEWTGERERVSSQLFSLWMASSSARSNYTLGQPEGLHYIFSRWLWI